jgi:membrane-associated phospholipid phosphatase
VWYKRVVSISAAARRRVAAIVSIVGHPFVLAPLTIAFMVRPARIAVTIALCMVGAMLCVIAWRVATGRWSDYDVSDPQQRHGFYPVALVIVAVSTAASWFLHMPMGFIRAMVIVELLLATSAVFTRYTKVSLHVLFGAFCAVIVSSDDLRVGLLGGLLVLAIGWSRVVLGRHSIAQVWIGAVLGGVFGALLVLLNDAH